MIPYLKIQESTGDIIVYINLVISIIKKHLKLFPKYLEIIPKLINCLKFFVNENPEIINFTKRLIANKLTVKGAMENIFLLFNKNQHSGGINAQI